MSTRGFVAWKIDGKITYTYNHSDSYPSWLGNRVVEFLRDYDVAQLRENLGGLRLVDEQADALPDDVAKYAHLARSVSTGIDNYALFRELQGDLAAMISVGIACTISEPSGDGEYGYTIDLDAGVLEIGESVGRDQWKVIATYPLDALPVEALTD